MRKILERKNELAWKALANLYSKEKLPKEIFNISGVVIF